MDESTSSAARPSVLIVDDEPQIVEFLHMGFSYEGFQVYTAMTGTEAVESALAHRPDLIVLDIMLPERDGLEVMREIRRSQEIPIILLTAKGEIDDRVAGLDRGADDYITKPFAFRELMARARSVMRRRGNSKADVLSFHDITLARGTRLVTRQEREVDLTPREFDLLELFLMHPRQVLSRDIILSRVWGYDYEGDDNIIEVYIRHLREKLQDNPPRLIHTVRGVGYSLRG